MFITLLVVTFVISWVVAFIVVLVFGKPIDNILRRIIADEISQAWLKYLKFAIYVVGVSSGVRIWELEKYITPPQTKDAQVIELTNERWVLEVYRTIIEALQGIAWLLLVFFIFALIAFVIVRVFEIRKPKTDK
jgi:ABC-type transport system involved in multi-copper enzyme maturation permease subunit